MADISIVVAFDQNNLIGKDNHLPWKINEDLSFFRETTFGHPVIMGKKTWNSIGKPLSGRINIILTHDESFSYPGCVVVNSIEQIINDFGNQQIFVIGGANVYEQFLPIADTIYLTRIHHEFEGDTFFPELDWTEWEITYYEHKSTESGIVISFEKWIKKPM